MRFSPILAGPGDLGRTYVPRKLGRLRPWSLHPFRGTPPTYRAAIACSRVEAVKKRASKLTARQRQGIGRPRALGLWRRVAAKTLLAAAIGARTAVAAAALFPMRCMMFYKVKIRPS
jgi:hypothetical protein